MTTATSFWQITASRGAEHMARRHVLVVRLANKTPSSGCNVGATACFTRSRDEETV